MVDINTLLVPGSKTYVVGALLINNRGEIGCIGSNPENPAHRTCLLIPCDENHSGIDGCDYDPVDAAVAAQVHAAPLAPTAAKAAILSSLSPAERIERFRSMAGQHGKVGRLLPK